MVNRKKQKRRQKQAARLASDQDAQNGYASSNQADGNEQRSAFDEPDIDDDTHSDDGRDFTAEDDHVTLDTNYDMQDPSDFSWRNSHRSSLVNNAPKKKSPPEPRSLLDGTSTYPTPSIPPLPDRIMSSLSAQKLAKSRSIWNTTTQEERENIKSFWLELGEDERRQLVKVEKDAVLKKMKEQQKHSCSCTVCGRKRTAIEEELEVLYDAYYEELEQYANHNQGATPESSVPVPPQLHQHFPPTPRQPIQSHSHFHHSPSCVHDSPEGGDTLDDEYDEEYGRDESYSDNESQDDTTRAARADFFAFGNSLTVKGEKWVAFFFFFFFF